MFDSYTVKKAASVRMKSMHASLVASGDTSCFELLVAHSTMNKKRNGRIVRI